MIAQFDGCVIMCYGLVEELGRRCRRPGCGNYSVWGSLYCRWHGGVSVGLRPSSCRSCLCGVYSFPHRAGVGRCTRDLETRVR